MPFPQAHGPVASRLSQDLLCPGSMLGTGHVEGNWWRPQTWVHTMQACDGGKRIAFDTQGQAFSSICCDQYTAHLYPSVAEFTAALGRSVFSLSVDAKTTIARRLPGVCVK